MNFVCEWSHLPTQTRTYIPGKRSKIGTFADVNSALAWLENKKPRNWRQKVATVGEHVKDKRLDQIARAPEHGWTLNNEARVLPPTTMSQTWTEWEKEQQKKSSSSSANKGKRKRTAAVEIPQTLYRMDGSVSDGKPKKYKVTIIDDNKKKVLFTDNWRAEVMKDYDMSHGMPCYFESNHGFTLHPLLACDGKTMRATPCRVRVQLQQP